MIEENSGKKALKMKKKVKLTVRRDFNQELTVDVMDFPDGPDGAPRRRFTLTLDYSKYDVSPMLKEHATLDEAVEHYRDQLYRSVAGLLMSDWECAEDDLNGILGTIREKIAPYFQ